jgi:hypothetical protein
MASNDQRRVDADIYICEAIKALQAVQSKHLAHTDVTTVRAALDGLGIVQRSIAGAAVANDARVAARLRQVATAVKSCAEPADALRMRILKSQARYSRDGRSVER